MQRNYVTSRIRVWEEELERDLINTFKGNKKRFYGYTRSKQQVKSNVSFVKNEDNILTTTEQETAEVLNKFFQSVFVEEKTYTSGIRKRLADKTLSEIQISRE